MENKIIMMENFLKSSWGIPMANRKRNKSDGIFCNSTNNDMQSEYVKNYIELCQAMNAIITTQQVELKYMSSQDYNDYIELLGKARSAASGTVLSLNTKLGDMSGITIELLDSLESLFENAMKLAQELQKETPTILVEEAKKDLKLNINTCISKLVMLVNYLQGLVEGLDKCKNTFPQQEQQMKEISQKLKKISSYDGDKVKKLKSDINGMRDEISSLSAAIAGLGLADLTGLLLGVLALAGAGPAGLFAWIFVGAVIAVSTTYIVLDAKKIKDLNAQIKANLKEVSDYEADIVLVDQQALAFQEFSTKLTRLQNGMEFIISAWKGVIDDLNDMKTLMDTSIKNISKSEWEVIEENLNTAVNKNKDLKARVKQYDISDVKFTDAKMEVGMSQDEIKNTIDKAGKMTVDAYINKVLAS